MSQPRPIQPYHFQAILSWWNGTFNGVEYMEEIRQGIDLLPLPVFKHCQGILRGF